jgi:signal transduction histidine kinase
MTTVTDRELTGRLNRRLPGRPQSFSCENNNSQDALALNSWAEYARGAFGAEAVLIGARPSGRGEVVIGADGLEPVEYRPVQKALEALAPVLAEGQVTAVEDLSCDSRTARLFPWEARGLRTVFSAPLVWDGRTVGAMHALNPDLERIGDNGQELVAVARQTALAIAYERLRSKTTRLSAELESVISLDQIVLEATTIDEMGHLITERLAATLGAASGGIMVYDEERDVLQTLPGAFGVSDDDAVSYRIKTDHPRSNSARVFNLGKPNVSNEAAGDPAIMQDYVDLFHVERLLSLPLWLGGRKVGVLHLANKPSPFTAYDVYRAQMLAPRIATVVELGTAMLRLRRHQLATEILVDAALGVTGGGDMNQLIGESLEKLGDVIETSILAFVTTSGPPIVWSRPGVPPHLTERLLQEASGRSSRRDGVDDPRGAGDPGSASLFVPVCLAGKRIATLATLRRRADPFVETDRAVLTRMASVIAVGWATERYHQQRAEVATLRERQRIADDLHDTVAQLMFAAQLNLDAMLEDPGLSQERATDLVRARSLLLKGDGAIREVIHQLAQPIRGDLAESLGVMVQGLSEEFQTSIRLEVPDPVAEAARTLRRATAEVLVKTAREAAVNSIKHAGPCSISIRLGISHRNRLVLTVTDDGSGGSLKGLRKGHGLDSARRAMRNRGGVLRVYSGEVSGTKVLASVPL